MLKLKSLLKPIYFVALFTFSTITFTNCGGGGTLPPEVCEIGGVVCNISEYICENYPVPENVCTYLNIACINLELLCSLPVDSPGYDEAKMQVVNATKLLNEWLANQQPDSLGFR